MVCSQQCIFFICWELQTFGDTQKATHQPGNLLQDFGETRDQQHDFFCTSGEPQKMTHQLGNLLQNFGEMRDQQTSGTLH